MSLFNTLTFAQAVDRMADAPEEADLSDVATMAYEFRKFLRRQDGEAVLREKARALVAKLKHEELSPDQQALIDSIGPTKYAVGCAYDQTIAYYTSDCGPTIDHSEATLFDSKDQADIVCQEQKYDFVEAVLDEQEFRCREDTW